jgi:hypothetical protein
VQAGLQRRVELGVWWLRSSGGLRNGAGRKSARERRLRAGESRSNEAGQDARPAASEGEAENEMKGGRVLLRCRQGRAACAGQGTGGS